MQILQYSQDQVHHSGTAARPMPNGEVGDDCEFGSVEENGDEDAGRPPTKRRRFHQLFIYPRSVTQMSWKRREGVVRRSWRSCASRGSVTQVVGRRTTVVQRSLQSVVKESRRKVKKVWFYIALYPVRWTAQSALHFPPLADLFIPTPFSASLGSILAMQQLRNDYSLTFLPLSIARYSFIQLSRLRRREVKENAQTSKR